MAYEAMLASGRPSCSVGDRVRVYRTMGGPGGVVEEEGEGEVGIENADRRDYDVDHYFRLLLDTFAARLQ